MLPVMIKAHVMCLPKYSAFFFVRHYIYIFEMKQN